MDVAAEIEQVVREVLARLQQAPPASTHSAPSVVAVVNAAELVLSERVITAGLLAGRLQGKTSVSVPPKAVVTPAAKDLLRAAKVTLTYATKTTKTSSSSQTAKTHLVLGVAETKYEPASLLNQLRKELEIEQVARTGLASVTAEVADHVSRNGRWGLVITDDVAAALCVANRRRGVRAIVGTNKPAVERGLQTLAANLLVLEPARQSLPSLRQMILAFARGPRTLAEGYRSYLD